MAIKKVCVFEVDHKYVFCDGFHPLLTSVAEDQSSKINESMRQKLADLGTIKVYVYRVIELGIDEDYRQRPADLLATTQISEKALKGRGLSHAVESVDSGSRQKPHGCD